MEIDFPSIWQRHKKSAAINGACTVVFLGLLVRLIFFSEFSDLAQKSQEAFLLDARIEDTVSMLKRESIILDQSRRVADELRVASSDLVVTPENTLGWASRALNRYALQAGVEIRDIIELTDHRAPWQDDPDRAQVLDPLSIRVDMIATIEQAIEMVAAIEADNPYACLVSFTAPEPNKEAPRRRITLVAEWPMWTPLSSTVQELVTNIH